MLDLFYLLSRPRHWRQSVVFASYGQVDYFDDRMA